jgi:hypothetical protein
MECYVCYDAGDTISTGCGCRGGTSHVHARCLVRCAASRTGATDLWSRCSTCKQHHTGEALFELARSQARDSRARGRTEHFLEATLVLSHCLKERGEFRDAERMQHYVYKRCARSDADEGRVLAADFLLETLLDRCHYEGEMGPALDLGRALHRRRRELAGPDSPCSLLTSCNYAIAMLYAGQAAEARALLAECIQSLRRQFGETRLLRRAVSARARCLLALGEDTELAVGELESVLASETRELGPSHPETLCTASELARAYADHGRLGDALPLYEQVRGARRGTLGPEHPEMLLTDANWASCLSDVGRAAEAEPVQRALLASSRRVFGVRHENTAVAKANLRRTRARLRSQPAARSPTASRRSCSRAS